MAEILVAVLGMGNVEDASAKELLARAPGERAGGRIDAHAPALGIDLGDADDRMLVGDGEALGELVARRCDRSHAEAVHTDGMGHRRGRMVASTPSGATPRAAETAQFAFGSLACEATVGRG